MTSALISCVSITTRPFFLNPVHGPLFWKIHARHTHHRIITSAIKVIFELTSPLTPSARQERHQPWRQELECRAGRYVRPASLQEQAFKEKLLRKLRESLISRDALEAARRSSRPGHILAVIRSAARRNWACITNFSSWSKHASRSGAPTGEVPAFSSGAGLSPIPRRYTYHNCVLPGGGIVQARSKRRDALLRQGDQGLPIKVMAAANAASTSRRLVSSTWASAAGRRGAAARP